MYRPTRYVLIAICVCVGAAFFATAAHAAPDLKDAAGSFSGLLELIQQSANGWADRLREYAIRIFWTLATIQLVWTFFPLVLRQADFGEIAGELVRFILVIGFFFALLTYSVEWADAIVQSFRQAAGAASGLGKTLRPGDMFGLAVELTQTIGTVQTYNPLTAVTVSLAGLVVLLCFAFIAAFMGVTLVESYIVINASVLFMGFGGSQWTREYAIAMARYAVAVGAKLFVLTLLVGLIIQSAQEWQAAYNASRNDASMWTMVGLSLVCAYMAKQIPDLVQSLITGTSTGGGHALGGMAMAAAGVATAGVAAAALPAVAGAAGAGSGMAGAASGSAGPSGLAGLINSSVSGGGNMARPAPSGLDGMVNPASTISPRIGGASGARPTPPQHQNSAPSGQQNASVAANVTGDGEAAGASQTASTTSGEVAPPVPAPAQGGLSWHNTAAGAIRTIGTLSAISVPGMEGAAGLSIGPPPPAPSTAAPDAPSADFRESKPENIISPAPATSPSREPPSPPKNGEREP